VRLNGAKFDRLACLMIRSALDPFMADSMVSYF
jgi:hypothetical protein